MPDLKLDVETAVATIGRELDRGIESLRRTSTSLIDDLKNVAEMLDGPMKLNIADADVACVIDFGINVYNTGGSGMRRLELRFENGTGGYVELANGLQQGRYRAVILINKIDE